MGQRNVAPVEDGGKHPWIFLLVNIPSRDAGDAGFRWPIHSMSNYVQLAATAIDSVTNRKTQSLI